MGSGASTSRLSRTSAVRNKGNDYEIDRQESNDYTRGGMYSTDNTMNAMLGQTVMKVADREARKKKEKEEARKKILLEYPELADAMEFVREGMQEISNTIHDDIMRKKMNDENKNILVHIFHYYFDCEEQIHKKILGDELSQFNGGKICTDYLKVLSDYGKEIPSDRYDQGGLDIVLNVCWNYSDASSEFAKELGRMGALPILVQYITNFKDKVDDESIRTSIITPSIAILHNCARNPDNKKHFGNADALGAIIPYTKFEYQELKMVAMMTLSYIIEEKDSDKISADGTMIAFIMMYLENAIKGLNHKYEGFSAHEIVSGIMHLASNDDNKLKIVKQGVLPFLVELLQNGDKAEKKISAKTVWVLAFKDENTKAIREEENMMDLLNELAACPGNAQESAAGALWVLGNAERLEKMKAKEKEEDEQSKLDLQPSEEANNEDDQNNTKQSNNQKSSQGHVMISYQWGCQKLMLRVKDRLAKMNYNVWIDVESIGGSTLGAMADAVENSAVVLICMSPKYKESVNCRTEGEYAYKLGKPLIPIRIEAGYDPDGWLGALQGAKFWVDFSNLMAFEVMFSRLVKELGDKGKVDVQNSATMEASVMKLYKNLRQGSMMQNFTSQPLPQIGESPNS